MMLGAMRNFWKVFVGLALTLPLGAFVAGNLVASAADDPSPRDTIIIEDQSATPSGEPSPTPSSTATPDSSPTPDQGDDGLEHVTPSPSEWDDDSHGGGHGGGHGGDDNSGPGSSGGSSGSGSGGSSGDGGGDD
jgi:hypothetical protein